VQLDLGPGVLALDDNDDGVLSDDLPPPTGDTDAALDAFVDCGSTAASPTARGNPTAAQAQFKFAPTQDAREVERYATLAPGDLLAAVHSQPLPPSPSPGARRTPQASPGASPSATPVPDDAFFTPSVTPVASTTPVPDDAFFTPSVTPMDRALEAPRAGRRAVASFAHEGPAAAAAASAAPTVRSRTTEALQRPARTRSDLTGTLDGRATVSALAGRRAQTTLHGGTLPGRKR
jgi:hypothetical protein